MNDIITWNESIISRLTGKFKLKVTQWLKNNVNGKKFEEKS